MYSFIPTQYGVGKYTHLLLVELTGHAIDPQFTSQHCVHNFLIYTSTSSSSSSSSVSSTVVAVVGCAFFRPRFPGRLKGETVSPFSFFTISRKSTVIISRD